MTRERSLARLCPLLPWFVVLVIVMILASYAADRVPRLASTVVLQSVLVRGLGSSVAAVMVFAFLVHRGFACPSVPGIGLSGLILLIVGCLLSMVVLYPALSFHPALEPVFRYLDGALLVILVVGLAWHQVKGHSGRASGSGSDQGAA
jgi:hypothetical protein